MEYKKVKITPQIAEQWLQKYNVRNRPMSTFKILNFAVEMMVPSNTPSKGGNK